LLAPLLLLAVALVLAGACSNGEPRRLLLPNGVTLDEVQALIASHYAPPGFSEIFRESEMEPSVYFGPDTPRAYVGFADENGGRITFTIRVSATDARIENYTASYAQMPLSALTGEGDATSCRGDDCLFVRAPALNVGESSASFESQWVIDKREITIDLFVRGGVAVVMVVSSQDTDVFSHRYDLLAGLDRRIQDLVLARGVAY
jgi:hypothetical protein